MLGRFVVLACALSFAAAEARAQDCNREAGVRDVERARSLFIEGSRDVESYRWADAIPKFEEAYALSCAPSALYNLAMALRALGRHREARDAFDRLLANHSDLGGELRTNAEQYRREEAARVAVLLLAGFGPDVRPDISFDGQGVTDDGTRPLRIETDAGAHTLVAQIPAHQPFLWEGRLGDGETRSVELTFEPLPAGGFDALPLVLGITAAVLVGAGIGLGVFLWDDAQLRPLNPDRAVSVSGG
ncbi:MAG TPA: tetratricopeptide repeat protein [Sandaracinaceae bacterium]